MSVVVKEIKKSELPFAYELTLADAASGAELPLRVLRSFIDEKGYSAGLLIEDAEAEAAVEASRVCECAVSGVKLLAYSDNSVRKLARKLVSKGYERGCAETAARALSDIGYINEGAQIERRGRAIAEQKLRGRRRVVSDLIVLGYDREAISEWERGCGIDYVSICARAIERRGGMPPRGDDDGRRRLLGYLYRQGFSGEDIRGAAHLLSQKEK